MGKQKNKHGRITKPILGKFARNEYAIMGTTCSRILDFSKLLARYFKEYNISYLDANHNAKENMTAENELFHTHYLDNINFQQLNVPNTNDSIQNKKYFNDSDIVLINGNHFEGQSQIIILDPTKEKSLYKRREQITNVSLIVDLENNDYCPIFLDDILKEKQDIPRINIHDVKKITSFFESKLKLEKPPLRGLVLAGGKSTRMGTDKGRINLNGTESREYFYNMLDSFCIETFISGRADQEQELEAFPFLKDRMYDMGPFGALISAFMYNPNTAWLVVATDLYQLKAQTLEQLVEARNTSKIATAFNNKITNFPDPLCTIWEPKSYAHILEFMRLGYSCPRKVLINSDIELVTPNNPAWLFNVNTKEDLQKFKNSEE